MTSKASSGAAGPAAPGAVSIATHRSIDGRWSGEPVELGPGFARVALTTRPEMAADETGLVHGGFVFSLADYAAMLAVNEPHVVLAGAQVRFLAPVAQGERLEARARAGERRGRRVEVVVKVACGERPVMAGDFSCAVLDRHVLAPPEGAP
jgi:uncharacterized protein (TIGR00369 family)